VVFNLLIWKEFFGGLEILSAISLSKVRRTLDNNVSEFPHSLPTPIFKGVGG
jgi:hypothetical protein